MISSTETRPRCVPAAILALIMCVFMFGSLSSAKAEPYAPIVGQRHPDFTLPRIDNRAPVSLSDLRGKKVLLIQFASW
jgi:hypothetical protein